MLIYIVEDDTDIRELESYAMKSSGYEVQSFGESKSFFKACTAEIPQLVILDVILQREVKWIRSKALTWVPMTILQNLFQSLSLFQESVQSSADVLLMTDRM